MKYTKKAKYKIDIRKISKPKKKDISEKELYEEMLRAKRKLGRRR